MKSNGSLSDSLGLILNMIRLMQIQYKNQAMNIKLIKTEADYQIALKRLELVFDAKTGTTASDEADILGLMIDEYEKKHYPIEAPDPIEAIKIRMEEMQLKQVDLADAIGGENRVSEVLNRKRKLTVEMIRNLTVRLNLSPGLLINDYQLTGR
jgi:HTH-type transcriptional regulator/antitoxin HigA